MILLLAGVAKRKGKKERKVKERKGK